MSGRDYLGADHRSGATYFALGSYKPGILLLPNDPVSCPEGWGDPLTDGEGLPINFGMGTCGGVKPNALLYKDAEGNDAYKLHSKQLTGPQEWVGADGSIVTIGLPYNSSGVEFDKSKSVFWKGKEYVHPTYDVYGAAIFNGKMVVICCDSQSRNLYVYTYLNAEWVLLKSQYSATAYTTIWNFNTAGTAARAVYKKDLGSAEEYTVWRVGFTINVVGDTVVTLTFEATPHQGIKYAVDSTSEVQATYVGEQLVSVGDIGITQVSVSSSLASVDPFPYYLYNTSTNTCVALWSYAKHNKHVAPELLCSDDPLVALQEAILLTKQRVLEVYPTATLQSEDDYGGGLFTTQSTLGGYSYYDETVNEYVVEEYYRHHLLYSVSGRSMSVIIRASKLYQPLVSRPNMTTTLTKNITTYAPVVTSSLLFAGYEYSQEIDITAEIDPLKIRVTTSTYEGLYLTCKWNRTTINICWGGLGNDSSYSAGTLLYWPDLTAVVAYTVKTDDGAVETTPLLKKNGTPLYPDSPVKDPHIVYYNPHRDVMLRRDADTYLPTVYRNGILVHTIGDNMGALPLWNPYLYTYYTFRANMYNGCVIVDDEGRIYISYITNTTIHCSIRIDPDNSVHYLEDAGAFSGVPTQVRVIGRT